MDARPTCGGSHVVEGPGIVVPTLSVTGRAVVGIGGAASSENDLLTALREGSGEHVAFFVALRRKRLRACLRQSGSGLPSIARQMLVARLLQNLMQVVKTVMIEWDRVGIGDSQLLE
jgi:hypothetical protein